MSDVWTEAEFIDPNSPKGREIQLRHLEGFTARRLAEARQKREQEEKAKEARQQSDLELAKAIAGEHALPSE